MVIPETLRVLGWLNEIASVLLLGKIGYILE